MTELLAAASTSSSFDLGQNITAVAISFLLFIGVIHSIRIARRPETNAKAAYAIGTVCGIWLLSSVYGLAPKDMLPTWTFFAMGGTIILGLLMSLVLAGLGLAEMRERPEEIQGRKQAIWSIILAGLVLIISGSMVANQIRNPQGPPIPSKFIRAGSTPGALRQFPEAGIEARVPQMDWKEAEISHLNPIAACGFIRQTPNTFVMIISEPGVGALFSSNETFADTLYTSARTRNPSLTRTISEPMNVGRREGHRYDTVMKGKRPEIYYLNYVFIEHNTAVQIIAWTSTDLHKDESKIAEILRHAVTDISPGVKVTENASD